MCLRGPKRLTYLIVLRFPFVNIRSLFNPLLVLRNGEEVDLLLALRDLEELVNRRLPT